MDEEVKESVEKSKLDPLDRLAGFLLVTFDAYQDQMQALRDIIDATTPYASALDNPDTRLAKVTSALRNIPKDQMPAVMDVLERARTGELGYGQLILEFSEKFESEGWNYELIVAFHEAGLRQPRLPMLRNSLLTTAVASFETVVANVATEFYQYKPEALEMNARDREKEFSLKELKQFGSIDDAVEYTISRRVESLMFGGLGDWRRFFNDALKIDLSDLAINWAEFQEILLRRHVIVHNGGRASRRYIAQVKQNNPDLKLREGDVLECDQDYLEYAIDHLLVAGALLVAAVLVKFSRGDALSSKLIALAYSLLRNARLEATKQLCKFGMSMPIDQEDILTFKVNSALAVKASLGIDGISKEIEAWDVSALSDRFKLAKASLLGHLDEAFRLLPILVEKNQITAENLLEWPLLAEMRKDSRFTPIITRKVEEAEAEKPDAEFVVLNTKTGVAHKSGCRFAKSGTRIHIDAPDVKGARHCAMCWQ